MFNPSGCNLYECGICDGERPAASRMATAFDGNVLDACGVCGVTTPLARDAYQQRAAVDNDFIVTTSLNAFPTAQCSVRWMETALWATSTMTEFACVDNCNDVTACNYNAPANLHEFIPAGACDCDVNVEDGVVSVVVTIHHVWAARILRPATTTPPRSLMTVLV